MSMQYRVALEFTSGSRNLCAKLIKSQSNQAFALYSNRTSTSNASVLEHGTTGQSMQCDFCIICCFTLSGQYIFKLNSILKLYFKILICNVLVLYGLTLYIFRYITSAVQQVQRHYAYSESQQTVCLQLVLMLGIMEKSTWPPCYLLYSWCATYKSYRLFGG